MSSERLVRKALEDSVKDLTFPEPDIEQLVAAGRTVRRRRVGVVASMAAAAVLVLVLATTALWRTEVGETLPAAPPLSAADLAGVWMVDESDSSGHLWHFTADGRRTTTSDPKEYFGLEQDLEPPISIGAGDVLPIPELGEDCRGTVHLAPEGTMTLTPLGGATACPVLTIDNEWRFTRVSPMSLAGAALTEQPTAPAAEPQGIGDLAGTWLLRGTGTMLVILATSPDGGEYILDDDGEVPSLADERGTATLRPDGELVLQPTEGADPGCDTVYERVATTGNTLETTPAETSCGRVGGVSGTWIRLN